MKKSLIYITLFACICLYSCKETHTQSEIPEISPEYFIEKDFSLSYFADDIEYIPLDSQIMIQRVLTVEIIDSLIFITTSSDGPMLYSIDGKFIRRIGRRGMGPGEYRFGAKFTLDKINRQIYIIDAAKILVYDFNGKFIREFKRNIMEDVYVPVTFYMDNKIFGFTPYFEESIIPVRWFVYDTLGNLKHTEISSISGLNKNSKGILTSRCAYCFDNTLHYWNQFNDTVFQLTGFTHKAKYLFKKDKYRITPEFAATEERLGSYKYYSPTRIDESDLYLFMNYKQYDKEYLCIYNKSEKTFVTNAYSDNKLKGIKNDIDGGIAINPYRLLYQKFNNKEYLSNVISVIDLKEHIESDQFKNSKVKYPEKKKALKKLADSLDENDNPVLMLVRLKQ